MLTVEVARYNQRVNSALSLNGFVFSEQVSTFFVILFGGLPGDLEALFKGLITIPPLLLVINHQDASS